MSDTITRRFAASTVAALAAAVFLGGCTATESVSEPPVSTSAEQIIAGDRAVVELAQDLTNRFGPLQFSSVRAGDPLPEHARGLALDVMIPGWDTPAGQQLGDEIAAWIEAQNKVTHAYLDTLPGRDVFRDRLKQLYNYERFSIPVKKGGRYFYLDA